jgi:hypothetical protein
MKIEQKEYKYGWEAFALIYEDLTGNKAVKDF